MTDEELHNQLIALKSSDRFWSRKIRQPQYVELVEYIKRGLFKSNTGKFINADVNGAFQIMKKVAPNAYVNGVEGVVIHPIKVNII